MTRRQERPQARSGFAMVLAVMLIALVGVTIAGLSSLVAADARRTRQTRIDAQQRQFLLAGAADVAARAGAWGDSPAPENWNVPLPGGAAAVSCRVTPRSSADAADVVVEVVCDGTRRSQTLHFTRTTGHWRLSGAAELK